MLPLDLAMSGPAVMAWRVAAGLLGVGLRLGWGRGLGCDDAGDDDGQCSEKNRGDTVLRQTAPPRIL